MHGKGDGVVYSIPPDSPKLKLKIVSGGMNSDRLLSIRLYFYRIGDVPPTALESLDPQELTVSYGSSKNEVHPAKVRGNPSFKPFIQLSSRKTQMIELAFPIPSDVSTSVGVQSFEFYWKLRVGKKLIETQATVFDRTDRAAHNAPQASEFPADIDADNFWVEGGWLWW